VGERFPIHVRLSNAEYVEEGLTIQDQVQSSQMLEKLGIAFISVSSGLSPCWGHTRTLPSMVHECGLNVADAAEIKKALSIPVMVTGRLSDPYLAEDVLVSHQADLIGMARGLICDPEYVNKLSDGRVAEIRPCISCNNCHNRELTDRSTRCLYNVEAGREMELHIASAKVKKKVMIAGGGPAGMEAARVAKLRGHDVILFEKSARLGGRLQLASVAPHKDEYAKAVAFCGKELKRLNVDIRLNKALTREVVITEKPDAVIIATGAKIEIPALKGLDVDRALIAEQVLAGEVDVGQKAMIIGCGPVGAETAHFLAAQGKEVFIVEMMPQILPDMLPDFKWFLFEDFAKYNVDTMCDTVITGVSDKTVMLKSPDGERTIDDVDSIIFAIGGRPDNALFSALEDTGLDLMIVGDAKGPRDGVNAFYEGYMAAYGV
jgi:thioredoxin reductase